MNYVSNSNEELCDT